MKYLNKILIFLSVILVGFTFLGFKLSDKKVPIIEKQLDNDKRALLQSLVGSYSLGSISGLMGANTMFNYTIENGQWSALFSSMSMGMREAYDMPLEPEVIKTLNGLKITVEADLSVAITVNGMKYLNSPFNENGVNYQLKKSPTDYYQLPEGFSARTTFIDGSLYIFAGDNIAESETAFADSIGLMKEAAIIRYHVESKYFDLLLLDEGGGTATLNFYK